tara:strand:+ start:17330 stop:17674 length:345 start_codon:yes stop_codon:yes gene_type:complete
VTPDEAKHALLAMSQAWPTKISDPTLHLWNNRLTRLDFAQTIKAIDQLMDTSKFWPAWSELKETVDAIKRAETPMYELEAAPDRVAKDRALGFIAEARLKLSASDASDRTQTDF